MILLDALSLYSGGARTHLRAILSEPVRPELTVIATPSLQRELSGIPTTFLSAPERTRGAGFRAAWRRAMLGSFVKKVGARVYFDPAGGAPRLPVPRVMMVRNMLPFDPRVERWYGRMTYQGQRLKALKRRIIASVESAEGAIFISDWSREVVFHELAHPPLKHCVIPHAVRPAENNASARAVGPLRLLYISDIEPYKRQEEVALAYDIARAWGCALGPLTMAGQWTFHPYAGRVRTLVSRLQHGSGIRMAGWLDRRAIDEEIRQADIVIFASAVECCPNILLELMAAGKAIVCSGEPPMPEFASDSVLYADCSDPLDLARAIQQLAGLDAQGRGAMGARAAALVERTSWAATADRTWRFINEVAEQGCSSARGGKSHLRH